MRAEIKEYLKTVLDRIQNYQNNASGVQHNQHIIDLPYLNEFIKIHINNLGDPFYTPKIPLDPHSFPEERKVVKLFAEFLQLDPEQIWGYCSSCGSEGNLSGVRYGREIISQKYNGNNKKIFRELVTIERFYSIFQAQKVLFNSLTKKGLNIDKETNVTAYFLIRAELYQRLNAFLKFCRLQNGKYVKIENSEKWLKFLESKSKIKKNTIFKNRRSYLYKNLRMTILELDLLH